MVSLSGNEHKIQEAFDKICCIVHDMIIVSQIQLNIELIVDITMIEIKNNTQIQKLDAHDKIFENIKNDSFLELSKQ